MSTVNKPITLRFVLATSLHLAKNLMLCVRIVNTATERRIPKAGHTAPNSPDRILQNITSRASDLTLHTLNVNIVEVHERKFVSFHILIRGTS